MSGALSWLVMQPTAQVFCAALQELAAALRLIDRIWLQGQGEQDGALAHALNAGFNPAGSVDAHLQQQQLLQQRQLSAHSTTSELQLEGRQLSGQKPGELLLYQGVAGCQLVREVACCLHGSLG